LFAVQITIFKKLFIIPLLGFFLQNTKSENKVYLQKGILYIIKKFKKDK